MNPQNILVTGGAGFIGCNYTSRLIEAGHTVTVYDNLSRKGTNDNLEWLQKTHGCDSFRFVLGDLRDVESLNAAAIGQDAIFHLAGQVAVTTSVADPRDDFEINALGTFNVLEAARLSEKQPLVVYASTNKVYGGMYDIDVVERETRYEYANLPYGLPETQQLDFHSPYGCSKGAGDQYVRDYARIYDLPTVVFRQSCIYGCRQFGIEDQGWLAHFVIAASMGRQLRIYGDGKQVRDILWVEDLLNAYDIALENPKTVAGKVYNIGGGPDFTLSIWQEIEPHIARFLGSKPEIAYGDWRPGDQKVYVSDIRKAKTELGWVPQVSPISGLETLWGWIHTNIELFQ